MNPSLTGRAKSMGVVLAGCLVVSLGTACTGRTGSQNGSGLVSPVAEPKIVTVEPDAPSPMDADKAPVLPSLTAAELDRKARSEGLLGDVYFAFGRFHLSEPTRERLFQNARFLLEKRQAVILIEGHCDERGTHEYNLALGDRRAAETADYLIRLGVEPERIRILSYGEERAFCHESTEACWQLNRRAHFRVVEVLDGEEWARGVAR